MWAGKSLGMNDEYNELWEEVKGSLDAACADSIYGSDKTFRDWFEVVAYWDFANAGYDYDNKIREEDSEHLKEYKLSVLESEHGPFEKLWGFVTGMSEISYSQGCRLRCEADEDGQPGDYPPQFFKYYFQRDRETGKWETDQDQQKFNEFVDLHPIDYIPLEIEHYKEKGAVSWQLDGIFLDLLEAEFC